MINITKSKDLIIFEGHANYAEYGKDIVCASVSSIITTTVSAIQSIDNNAIKVIDEDMFIIKKIKDDDIVNKLIGNMLNLLDDLSKQYPKNLKWSDRNE